MDRGPWLYTSSFLCSYICNIYPILIKIRREYDREYKETWGEIPGENYTAPREVKIEITAISFQNQCMGRGIWMQWPRPHSSREHAVNHIRGTKY